MAEKLGGPGFYVTIGGFGGADALVISGRKAFRTLTGAEGFCRNNCLTWEPHGLPADEWKPGRRNENGIPGASAGL